MIPHSEANSEGWLNSPVRKLVEEQLGEVRYRMEEAGSWRDFPLLVDLQAMGATDYLALATITEIA